MTVGCGIIRSSGNLCRDVDQRAGCRAGARAAAVDSDDLVIRQLARARYGLSHGWNTLPSVAGRAFGRVASGVPHSAMIQLTQAGYAFPPMQPETILWAAQMDGMRVGQNSRSILDIVKSADANPHYYISVIAVVRSGHHPAPVRSRHHGVHPAAMPGEVHSSAPLSKSQTFSVSSRTRTRTPPPPVHRHRHAPDQVAMSDEGVQLYPELQVPHFSACP